MQGKWLANLQYLMQNADASLLNVIDESALALLMSSGGDISDFSSATDSLEAISNAVGAISTGDAVAEIGSYTGQSNLKTLLAALGIPDTTAKPLYTCIITDRLDNATHGLSALSTDIGTNQTDIDAILADVGDFSARTKNLKSLLAVLGVPDVDDNTLYKLVYTDMLAHGTHGLAALDTDLTTIINDLANGTDGLGALKTAIEAVPGTNSAALASSWTAALATALANYTAVRAGYIDDIKEESAHRSYIFPDLGSDIDLTCTLTSGEIDTYGTWAEITDSGATTFGSVITATGGHVSAIKIRTTSVDDVLYVIELGYGPDAGTVTVWDITSFGSGTKKIDSDEQERFRPPAIPSGQKVWYRMKTENNANTTAAITLRYHAHA